MSTPAVLALIIAFLCSCVFVSCGSDSADERSASSSSPNTFVLSEFTVIPPTNELRSGRITLTADNVGGEGHELVIVRADRAGALPMKPDGSIDEAKIAKSDEVGEMADIAAGSHVTKSFEFAAGTYVAFCNLVDEMMGHEGMASETGHVHFAQGMHVSFTVS